jgi:hypothetical protein
MGMKRVMRAGLIFAGVFLSGGLGDGQAVTAGLAAHWTFDPSGSLADAVGGNTLTKSGAGAVVPTTGMFGGAVDLDGTDDYLSAASSAGLNVGTGSFTVALWVRPSNTASVRAVNKWDGANQQGWLMDIHTTSGGAAAAGFLRFRLDSDLAPNAAAQNIEYSVDAGLGSGTWKHIAATIDTTANQLKLYVNGSQVGVTQTVPDTVLTLDNSSALGVGTIPSSLGKYFNGDIDDLRLYKAALTAAEVRTLVATAPPVLVSPPGVGVFQVTLDWAAVPGAVSYQPYISTTSGSGYTAYGAPVTGTTVTVSGLNPTPYFFVVTALNGVLPSVNSNEVTATPMLPVPRTEDHDEGTFGDRCACGSTVTPSLPFAAVAALLLAGAFRRRRLSF